MPSDTTNSNYDVVIIGAGIVGCALAYHLSSFKLKILVVEEKAYAASETTKKNSAILHGGFDANPKESKAKFNVEGRKLWEKWFNFLEFPKIKTPSLVIAFNQEEVEICKNLVQRGIVNGLSEEEVYFGSVLDIKKIELEQETDFGLDYSKIHGALICKSSWVIDPVLASRALLGGAMQNGVNYLRKTQVKKLEVLAQDSLESNLKVITTSGSFLTKKVINAAGANAGKIAQTIGDFSIKIKSRRGQYKVVEDKEIAGEKAPIIFGVPSKLGKGVLVAPRTDLSFIVGPTAQENIDFADSSLVDLSLGEKLDEFGRLLCPKLKIQRLIGVFAGTRTINIEGGDFQIEHSLVSKNLINVAAIQSPGLTSAPAIASYVGEKLLGLPLVSNPQFNPYFKQIW